MQKYRLKISGSNEVANTILIDPQYAFTAPIGYVTQSITTSSYISSSFIPTLTSSFNPQYSGELFGSANLSSLTINDENFYNILSSEKHGYLRYSHSIDFSNPTTNDGYFSFNTYPSSSWSGSSNNSPNLILVSLLQRDVMGEIYTDYATEEKWKQSIIDINENNLNDSYLSFRHRSKDVWKKFKIISSSLYTKSGSYSHALLNVLQVDQYSRQTQTSIDIEHVSVYYPSGSVSGSIIADYIYPKNLTVFDVEIIKGKFDGTLSGSFTGSFSGTSSYATFAETASKLEVFTTSSNWTKPSWAKTVKVVCVGGGGGGGGSFGVPSGQVTGGGGGAGGSVSMGEFDANLLPSSSISITVGAGGTGGGGQDGYGANGGSSMFDTLLIARGGDGGQGGTDMGGSLGYVRGGRSDGTINYLNTGGGPGGRGSVSARGITNLYSSIPMTVAPSLPLNEIYVDLNWNVEGYPGERMGIPAAIAPTGGGGGLGYDADNGGNQEGNTTGGSIKPNFSLSADAQYFYEPGGLVGKTYTYSVDGYVSAFYTKIGLGGKGGNPSASIAPSGGSRYGGGGGGAYGFYTGSYGPVSSGAGGADGVVIIISEA